VGRSLDPDNGLFEYAVDGSYGDYTIQIQTNGDGLETRCDCPYPGEGCKHIVAALLDISQNIQYRDTAAANAEPESPYLSPEEIRAQALEGRKKRARTEKLQITPGDMFKGEHLVETPAGRHYTVIFHDPANGMGRCSCPDFATNRPLPMMPKKMVKQPALKRAGGRKQYLPISPR
jgi:hypothetical protein